MQAVYMCEYCSGHNIKMGSKADIEEHERHCELNPANKHCLSCELFNVIEYPYVSAMGTSLVGSAYACTEERIATDSSMISGCQFHRPR